MKLFYIYMILLTITNSYAEDVKLSTVGGKSPVINAEGNVSIVYGKKKKNIEEKLRQDEIESVLYAYMDAGAFDFPGALEGLAPKKDDFMKVFKRKAAIKYASKYPDILKKSADSYRENAAKFVGVDAIIIKSPLIKDIIKKVEASLSKTKSYDKEKAKRKNQLAFYNTFRVSNEQYFYKIYFTTKTPFAEGKGGSIVHMKPRILYGFRGAQKNLVIIDAVGLYHSAFRKVFYTP